MNTVTTNVPGPQFPLYFAGRAMLEYIPYVPLGPGVRIGVAILSYNGQLQFAGDYDTARHRRPGRRHRRRCRDAAAPRR